MSNVFLSSSNATCPVVPLPAKGSNIISPSLLPALIQGLINSGGKVAK